MTQHSTKLNKHLNPRALVHVNNDDVESVILFTTFSHLKKKMETIYEDEIESEQTDIEDGKTDDSPITFTLQWLKDNECKEDVITGDYVIYSSLSPKITQFTIKCIK